LHSERQQVSFRGALGRGCFGGAAAKAPSPQTKHHTKPVIPWRSEESFLNYSDSNEILF